MYKLTVHWRLEHNPLECDCSLDWLLDYETLATLARCHAPNHLAGKRIVELKARAKDAPGSKDWARSILGRYEAGENVRPVALRFAREAMGVK